MLILFLSVLNRVPAVEESEALVDVVEDPGVGVDVERLDHVVESSQALISEAYNSLSMDFQWRSNLSARMALTIEQSIFGIKDYDTKKVLKRNSK